MTKKSVKSWGLLVNGRLTPFADRDKSEIRTLVWDYEGKETKIVRVTIAYEAPKKRKAKSGVRRSRNLATGRAKVSQRRR